VTVLNLSFSGSLLFALLWSVAIARTPEEAQLYELEKLRGEVAGQIQLAAYDLLDELVYHWTQSPPFTTTTSLFLADLSVPVGLGSGLGGLLENHLAALLLANPNTKLLLSHCPSCTAMILHSGPKGTVISRGLDNPEALRKLGGPSEQHGLYIDISAEGSWLVLRARITRLTPELPILWSRTLSSAGGVPSLLRQPSALKSAAEARREYLDVLHDRGPYTVPVRFVLRAYNVQATLPIIWLQTGAELALSQARSWTAGAIFGFTWLPEAYSGIMLQSRMSRLISGETHSLTRPDLYLFFGGALMMLDGPAATPFRTGIFSSSAFAGLHLGLEFRVGNRVGVSVFLENMPAFYDSEQIGVFWENELIDIHSFGTEVTFCF